MQQKKPTPKRPFLKLIWSRKPKKVDPFKAKLDALHNALLAGDHREVYKILEGWK
jgi:hypothetical protein